MIDQARHVRFGQKYLITGTAAHPRRILIEELAHDDPRRIAAETRDSPQTDNTVQRG